MILQVSNVKKWKKETGRIEKVNKKSQKGKRVIPTQNPDEVPKEKLKVSSSQAPRKKRHLNRIPGAKDMGSQSLKEKSSLQISELLNTRVHSVQNLFRSAETE